MPQSLGDIFILTIKKFLFAIIIIIQFMHVASIFYGVLVLIDFITVLVNYLFTFFIYGVLMIFHLL